MSIEKAKVIFDLPKDVVDAIDRRAAGELLSRSAWLRRAVAQAAGVLRQVPT